MNVRVRPLEHDDIETLRVLRNDAKRSEFLTPLGFISPEMQENWYREFVSDESIHIWAIDYLAGEETIVGSGALYDFSENKCEQGKIMIAPEYGGKGIGTTALALIADIGFSTMGIDTMVAHINVKNIASLKMFKKIGYSVVDERPTKEGGYEYCLSITKDEFYENANVLLLIHGKTLTI